jgi:hypothetical protein
MQGPGVLYKGREESNAQQVYILSRQLLRIFKKFSIDSNSRIC